VLLTLRAYISFSQGDVNLNVLGVTVTLTSGGISTLMAYNSGGPRGATFVTIRNTTNGVGCRGTVMVG
jgi:hypothetical protein